MAEKQFGQRINIELGANLMIEVKGIETKLKSQLIGLIPSEYLIIKAPIGHTGIRDKLVEDNKVTVKYIQQGHVYAFQAFILGLVTKPKTMLVIDYPTKVASASLRKSVRHDCYIPCSITIEGQDHEGTILDLSHTGCRCLLPGLNTKLQRKIDDESLEARLGFESPGDKSKIEVAVKIVNNTEYKSASKVGIAFNEEDVEAEQKLIKICDYLEK